MLRTVMGLLSRKVRSRADKLGVRYSFLFMWADGAQLEHIAKLVDDGVIRPVVDSTFCFEQVPAVLDKVRERRATGKVVVTLS